MTLDLRIVSRQLGSLLIVLSAMLAVVSVFAIVSGVGGDHPDRSDFYALLISAGLGSLLGGTLFVSGRKPGEMIGQREAILLVALSWICGAAVAALPFFVWSRLRLDRTDVPHPFDSWIDCYFESMSGLTTTGATILSEIATVPDSLLLWRALTHWLGGLGIVVLFVAVLPMLGVGGRRIFRIEAPGPSPEGVRPRIQDTARILWLMYCGLTVAEIIALKICGMTWFDSACHTFATLATGGFSTLDSSIAGFPSTAVHIVIIVFMFLAGVNFGLYYQILQRGWRKARKDPELRAYIGMILCATAVITACLYTSPPPGYATDASGHAPFATVLRDSLFQVVSIQTTTGFATVDFNQWTFPTKAILLVLMFVGGCAGSTGGGIKVGRILILVKVVIAELEHAFRPHVVRTTRVGKKLISPELKVNTLVFVVGIAGLFALGTAALMVLESGSGIDITTAATASAATLNNIGPGLARIGPIQTYAWFTAESKVLLSVLMVMGRLEIFTIAVLFMPRFWRSD